MAQYRLRQISNIEFDEGLDYLVDLLLDEEIDADELARQAREEGYSEDEIGRALAFCRGGPNCELVEGR